MADLFDEIIQAETEKVNKGTFPVKKAKNGRPKSNLRLKAEAEAAQKEFIEGYESVRPYRPEPMKLVVALSLPPHEQRQALEDALNPRQLAFCKEYIIDFNAAAASTRAGYSPKNAAVSGAQLLGYRGIRRLIEIYTENAARSVTVVDKDYIVKKVTEIVTTAAKDADKLRGLELLARHLGMFIDRTEISGRDGEAIKIEETKKEADDVLNRIRTMAKRPSLKVVGGDVDDVEIDE